MIKIPLIHFSIIGCVIQHLMCFNTVSCASGNASGL